MTFSGPAVDETRFGRTRWWREARFGLFLHWGAYAVPARGEWVRSVERMSLADYESAVDAFDPDPDFDAWADVAARAGMKYAVMTAKHHDGYALFDSAVSDYTTAKRTPQRDFVREYLDAFRRRGLKVGLYFSLLDWSRPDYPHHGDAHHPMRDDPAFADHRPDLGTYVDFLHAQVRELCTNYGALDLFWFDFSYDDLAGEAWRASDLVRMVRELQPDIIIDNRLEGSGAGYGSIVTSHPSAYSGDFASPEQVIPAEGLLADDGSPLPWESCITLNNHWGYAHADHHYKPARQVIRALVECVSKNGNLLVNVGPDARGRFPDDAVRILDEVGAWLARNERSIRGCGAASLPRPEWGRWTASAGALYAHVLEPPIGPLSLTGLTPDDVVRVLVEADGAELPIVRPWVMHDESAVSVSFGPDASFTYPLPDYRDTVLRIVPR